ncbi:BamA/TamA family outer membrane protein [candidate division KSB1 bacterium]|nr:BamA/TamA family outer membrane protein [candidate division KSB1 bacterium]
MKARKDGLFLLCFLLLVYPHCAGLAQISSDSIRYGVTYISRGETSSKRLQNITNTSKIALQGRAEIERGLRQVLERFHQQQYYEARVDSVVLRNAPKYEALVYLDSGPQYDVKLLATIADSAEPNRDWQRALGGNHNEAEWLARMQNVLEGFAGRGYPLAAFVLDSVAERIVSDDKKREAMLHFQLKPGPLVRIDSIVVRGNKTTKSHVLLRELPVRAGDLFNLEAVQSIPEKLLRLGFIRAVAPPELRVHQSAHYVLEITVTEGSSNTLNGVAGYNPSVGKQKGFLTGLIDVQFGNLFGTGRLVNAHWEKRGPETQELGLRYREPWVRGYPLHLSGGFQQLIQDTLYVERRFEVSAEAPLGNRFAVLGAFTRESVVPDSLSAIRLNLPRSQITSVSAGLRFDSRDDLFNPRRGFFYSTTVATGRKRVQGDSTSESFSHKLVTLDFQWLIPTKWPQVLSFAFHGRQVTSGEPEVSITDQIRFGGATTLRGYREEQFRGARVAWSNLEYRYLLSRYSRAFVFCDVGYYFREEAANESPASTNLEIESVKTSYGLGVRMETPLGIVGVDYGLGQGDGLFNGKVHVSLMNSF